MQGKLLSGGKGIQWEGLTSLLLTTLPGHPGRLHIMILILIL